MARRKQETLDHNRMRELLSPFLDGQVTLEEQALVENHLATCEECARELEGLRWTVGLLHQVPLARVPRSFAVPAARPAPRRGLLGWLTGDWAYGFLRSATALATLLLVIVISVDVLGVGRGGLLMQLPAAAPAPMAREAVVEKPAEVGEKVVEVEKEVVVTAEAATEVPQVGALKEMAPPAPPPTQEAEAARALALPAGGTPAPAPTVVAEDWVAATEAPPPGASPTEGAPPTVAAEVVAPATATPAGARVTPTSPRVVEEAVPAVPPAGPGLLRRVEMGLLVASLLLVAVTLAVRRQRAG